MWFGVCRVSQEILSSCVCAVYKNTEENMKVESVKGWGCGGEEIYKLLVERLRAVCAFRAKRRKHLHANNDKNTR